MHARTPRSLLLALLAAFALIVAACGDDDDADVSVSGDAADDAAGGETDTDTGGAANESFPVTVTVGGVDTTVEAMPEAIVSMNPTGTEILFAVGAGEQVIAVDNFSNFPEGTPIDENLSAYEPNLEAIVGLDPDLVVMNDSGAEVTEGLISAGIPTIVLPAATTLDDTYAQIEAVGAATGHVGDAAEVVLEMQTRIDELVASVPETDEAPTYYHELDNTLFSVTSQTFIGEIYSLAGLANVADAADPDGENFGYPQLSAEYLVDANPDFIFLADTICCDQTAETVAARPGFDAIAAVQNGRVVELNDDIASRWGPRVVDLLEVVVEAMAPATADS